MISGMLAGVVRRMSRHAMVWTLLVASLGLNVAQGQKLRALGRGGEASLPIGSRVPPIDLASAEGESRRIAYTPDALPTIVYFFSPRCGWCKRNWDSLATLERATRGRYRLLAVTTADPDANRDLARALPVSAGWRMSERSRHAYRFSGTPHTLVVSADGRVAGSWAGAYTGTTKEQVERFFQTRLPDIQRSHGDDR